MTTGAIIFMAMAWAFVLGLTFWSFYRLMRTDPAREPLPPPGSIP